MEFKQGQCAIGEYLYQLVPSVWCFAYYDTTQSFLQAQGRIVAPLIIQSISVVIHFVLLDIAGPAWSRNFSDMFSSISIYLYIIIREKKLESWIEWTIKCIKGWNKHLKYLEIIGLSTYMHALFFFFFSFLGYKLSREELICHIYYINIYQIVYLSFIGVQQGCLSKIGRFKENIFRKVGYQSIRYVVGSCHISGFGSNLLQKNTAHNVHVCLY